MAKEIVGVLKVETGGSEKTIKALKDEIKNLKNALEVAEIGSENFKKTNKDLLDVQNELKNAMASTKQTVEAADGSYNALVQTMAELKKEWKATADEAKRSEIGEHISEINSKLKELDSTIGNNQRNVGNYTESFSEAMKQQQEATEVTRAKLESIQKVASGLASGYAAVQGAMALMGTENEKLEKTFVKLQAAIALAQGVGGLKDLVEGIGSAKVAFKSAITGVKSFITSLNGMKAALISTGIGALVVALGTIVAYWDDIRSFVGFGGQVRDLNTEVDKLKTELTKKDDEDNFILRMKAAAGATKEELFELELQMLKTKQTEARNKKQDIGFEVDSLKRKKRWWNSISKEDIAEAEEAYKKAVEVEKAYSDEIQKVIDDRKVYREQQRTDAKKAAENAAADAAKAAADEKKAKIKAADELSNILKLRLLSEKDRELEILRLKNEEEKEILEGRKDALLQLEEAYQKEKQEIIDKYQKIEDEEKLKELIDKFNNSMSGIDTNQSFSEGYTETKFQGLADAESSKRQLGITVDNPVTLIQIEIDKMNDLRKIRNDSHNERLTQINELLSSELVAGELKKELEIEKANLIRQNALEEKRYINENSKLQKQKIEEEKKLRQRQATATIDTTKSMLSAVSSLMKEGSKAQKGVASAIAAMDALQAANGAYAAMASIPAVGPALGIAAAAAALISGYANVKAIWAVDEDGSNTQSMSGGSGSASVTPTFDAASAMPIEYTRNIMTNSEMESINQPTRVYVLESDISEAQNRVKVSESNASF